MKKTGAYCECGRKAEHGIWSNAKILTDHFIRIPAKGTYEVDHIIRDWWY